MSTLLVALLLSTLQPTWHPRPCEPWVLRADLDGHAGALVFALSPDLWTAYDGDTGAWLGARRLGEGTLVPESDEPWAGAPVQHPGEGGEPPRWALRWQDGRTREGTGRIVGLRLTDGTAHLLHAVTFDDGTAIEVAERVECWRPGLTREGRPVAILDRGFVATGLPEGAELVRWLALGPGDAIVDGEPWPGWEQLPVQAREQKVTSAVAVAGRVFTWRFFLDGAEAPGGMPQEPREPTARVADRGRRWNLVGPAGPVGGLSLSANHDHSDASIRAAPVPPIATTLDEAIDEVLLIGSGGALWALVAESGLPGDDKVPGSRARLVRLAAGLLDPVVAKGGFGGRTFFQRGRRTALLPDDDGDGFPDGWRLLDDDEPDVPDRRGEWWFMENLDPVGGELRAMRQLEVDAAQHWTSFWPLDRYPRTVRDPGRPRLGLEAAPIGAEHGLEVSLDAEAPFAVVAVRAFADGLRIEFNEDLAPDCGWDSAVFELTAEHEAQPILASAVTPDRHVVLLRTGPLPREEWLLVGIGSPMIDARGRRLANDVLGGRLRELPEARLPTLPARPTTPAPALSDAERAAGFEALPPSAWRGYQRDDLPDGWAMDDGALARVAPAGDIVSRELFGDFELRCEWRIAPGGNSGIMFRATESDPAVYMSAPEMQVLDDAGYPGLDARHLAGANYALHAAPTGAVAPVGIWNHVRIRVEGDRVQQWLNGVETADYLLWSPDWEARVAASKFAAWPAYGRAREGHLALQDHGDAVWYRNLRVLRIDAPK